MLCSFQRGNHAGAGSGERTKEKTESEREKKNASKDQGLAEVGVLAELLSKLRQWTGRGGGGNSWDSFLPNNALGAFMLTPGGERGEGRKAKVRGEKCISQI